MPRIQEEWQMMTVNPGSFSPRELAAKAARFDRQVRARNIREYAASLFVAGFFGWRATVSAGAAQAAAILLVLAAVWTAFFIWRSGAPIEPDPSASPDVQRGQWKRELERQKRMLGNVRPAYIAPFVPGFLLSALLPVIENWNALSTANVITSAAMLAGFAAVLWLVDRLNRNAARTLADTIAALD